jgi:4-amino-4-deoxy-L-arabinose transferase-like glycosyltransferase
VTRLFERLPPDPSYRRRARTALLLVLAAAALLRFWGLGHGIPFSVGVDEPEIMDRAVRMMKTGDFNPHFYDYPSLYIYVQVIVAIVRFITGAAAGKWGSLAEASTFDFYVWGRAMTAAIGTATVWLVYSAGLRWGTRTALLAAAVMAVMPSHVRESHFVLTDVPTTFFVMLTFLLSLRASEQPRTASFALAGVAAGLATATKYNGVVALAMPLIACVMTPSTGTARLHAALAAVGGCGAAFLIAAPYTLLDLPAFLNQFAHLSWQYRNQTVIGSIPIIYLKHLRNAFHWPTTFLVMVGFGLGLARVYAGPERLKWTLAITVPLLYFWFISNQHIVFGRYLLPIVPFLALLAAAAVAWIINRVPRSRVPRAARKAIAAALMLIAVVPVSIDAVRFNADVSRTWTTEMAYRWLLTNVPAGTSIAIESRGLLLPPSYKSSNVPQLRIHSAAEYAADGVDYLVASSQSYGAFTADPHRYPDEYSDYVRLFRETQEVARFIPSAEHPGPEMRVLKVMR